MPPNTIILQPRVMSGTEGIAETNNNLTQDITEKKHDETRPEASSELKIKRNLGDPVPQDQRTKIKKIINTDQKRREQAEAAAR